jgi:hypothetical protein
MDGESIDPNTERFAKLAEAFNQTGIERLKAAKNNTPIEPTRTLAEQSQKAGLTAPDIRAILEDPNRDAKIRELQQGSTYKHSEQALRVSATGDLGWVEEYLKDPPEEK